MTSKIGPMLHPLTQAQATPLHGKPRHGKAEEAAQQFENMMALQMIRSMQSSLDEGSMFGGGVAGDIYSGLAEWQLAQVLSKGSQLGIKEQILRQLPKAEEQNS